MLILEAGFPIKGSHSASEEAMTIERAFGKDYGGAPCASPFADGDRFQAPSGRREGTSIEDYNKDLCACQEVAKKFFSLILALLLGH